MAENNLNVAPLDQDKLNQLRSLEKELGVILVAYEPEPPLARLSEEQVARVQMLEKELGVVALAYQDR